MFRIDIKHAPKSLQRQQQQPNSLLNEEEEDVFRVMHNYCVKIKQAPNCVQSLNIETNDISDSVNITDESQIEKFVNVMQYEAKSTFDIDINDTSDDDELYRGIDILLTAHSPQILDSFGKFINLVADEFVDLGVEFGGYTTPRVHKDKWITNKAPFKYGRHKIEYEVRTYKKVVHLLYLTGSTRRVMLNYIQRNVPAGVGIEVRSFKLVSMPEQIKQHIATAARHLDAADIEYGAVASKCDTMETRKLKTDAFEARRQPWNMNQHDREKEEIMAFRRQWRQPMTVGRI